MGVALVTHNSEHLLAETLASIKHQSLPVTHIRIVDDASTDRTVEILTAWCEDMRSRGVDAEVVSATSREQHTITRTAQNFAQAARALTTCDLVALADHDDIWLPHRIETQVAIMEQHPEALMLASNGTLNADAEALTLFDAFKVPIDLNDRTCGDIARHVVRHSVATGSATMLRPQPLTRSPRFTPPRGWLHDRWWSILAASRCGLRIDVQPVIDYRVSRDQQVGLDRGRQASTVLTRASAARWSDLAKFGDLLSLRSQASPSARSAFSPLALVGALTTRMHEQ